MSAYGLELVGFIPTKTVVNEGEKEVKNNRQLWKYAAAAAIAIPIAFYSIWIPVKTPALESGMFSYQDFNPFKTQNENTYTETQIDLPRIEHVSIETTYRDAYELHVNPKVAPHEPTITLIEPHVMYCIAGCFSSEENANRLVQKLEGLGFNCSILHEGSLYKVSLGHGFSEESVDSILNKAKSLNIQTWILK
jgi:cell division septation protein DedD